MTNLQYSPLAVIGSIMLPIVTVLGFLLYEVVTIATGTPVALIVAGYDPSDFLRGHYILYDALTEELEILDPENEPQTQDGYVYREDGYILLEDVNGDGVYDTIGKFTWTKPSTPYLRAVGSRIFYGGEDEGYYFQLDSDQGRYYLDEDLASFVEDEIRRVGKFSIEGTVKQGQFRASAIEVDGKRY